MDQMVRNDIACNCILIVRIAFRYAHISFQLLFGDFNCVFMQIHCLSRVLGRVLDSRQSGHGLEPHRRHCVVVLEQDTWLSTGSTQEDRPCLTER